MKKLGITITMLAAFSLSACDDTPNASDGGVDNAVTETVLDDVDQIEGTISDAMINVEGLDGSTDEPEAAPKAGNEARGGSSNDADNGPDNNAGDDIGDDDETKVEAAQQ